MEKLQEVCDHWFNIPCKKNISIRPACDLVMLKLVDSSCSRGEECEANFGRKCADSECRSQVLLNQYEDSVGYMLSNSFEVTFFILDNNEQLRLFSPYRFTDNGIVMVNERELFGLPTSYGEFGVYEEHKYEVDADLAKKITGHYQRFDFNKRDPSEVFNEKEVLLTTMMHFDFLEASIVQDEWQGGSIDTRPEALAKIKGKDVYKPENVATTKDTLRTELIEYLEKLSDKVSTGFAERLSDLILNRRHGISMAQLRAIEDTEFAMVQTFFDYRCKDFEVLNSGKYEGEFTFTFDLENDKEHTFINEKQQEQINKYRKKHGVQERLIQKVRKVVEFEDEIGINDFITDQCFFIDVDYEMYTHKLISQQF